MAHFVECTIVDGPAPRLVHINLDNVVAVEPVVRGCAITFLGNDEPSYVVKGAPSDILRAAKTNI